MFGYYLQLALRSLRKNPGLTALMIGAVGLGIGVCVMTLTLYHADVGQPALVEERRALRRHHGLLGPAAAGLGRQAAPAAMAADLSRRDGAVRLRHPDAEGHHAQGGRHPSVDGQQREAGARPDARDDQGLLRDVRRAFPVRRHLDDAADTGPEPVMVISRKINEKLFGGANSVGRRIRWNDNEFRIVGVRDDWMPLPTFYDVNNGALDEPEDVYIPFRWNAALELD